MQAPRPRYLFAARPFYTWPAREWILEASRGVLRVYKTSATFSGGMFLLVFFLVVFGYVGGTMLLFASPVYQNATPWRYPGVAFTIAVLWLVGFLSFAIWAGTRLYLTSMVRFTRSHPERILKVDSWQWQKQVEVERFGWFLHKFSMVASTEMFELGVRATRKRLKTALALASDRGNPESLEKIALDR